MRMSAKNAGWILPLVLTGCFTHKNQSKSVPLAPPLPSAGAIKTEPVDLPADATTIPPKPTESAQTPAQRTPKPAPPRRRSQSKQPAAPPSPPADVAAGSAPAISAIGQLSSGDPSNYRSETEDSILSVEKSLNGLNRNLNDSEQKTADHIREFIKQARTALGTGDVDGAHNLAAKAKVLLAELTK